MLGTGQAGEKTSWCKDEDGRGCRKTDTKWTATRNGQWPQPPARNILQTEVHVQLQTLVSDMLSR